MSASHPDVVVAVLEQRVEAIDRWKDKHEREDDDNHTKIGTDVSKCLNGIDRLNITMEPIVKAYWGEDSSKVARLMEANSGKRSSVRISPEVKQAGVVSALVTVVIVLAEVIKGFVHPAPPEPPSTADIAAQVAKAIVAAQKEKP